MRRWLGWTLGALILSIPGSGVPHAVTPPIPPAVRTWTHREPIEIGARETARGVVLLPAPEIEGGENAAITHFEMDLVDEDGRPLRSDGVMLHHVVVMNYGNSLVGSGSRRDATCSSFAASSSWQWAPAWAERFFSRGAERSTLEFPEGYGYRLARGDRWSAFYMLMSHGNRDERVYLQYTVTWVTRAQAAGMQFARLLWLDVRNCRVDPVYSIAGGGTEDTQTFDFTLPESGRLVSGMGHLHSGGKRLELREPDCDDREVFRSLPTWSDPDEAPERMSGFTSSSGIPVAKGQRLRLASIYDAVHPHADVMGIMGVMFVPDPGVTPAVACGALPILSPLHDTNEVP